MAAGDPRSQCPCDHTAARAGQETPTRAKEAYKRAIDLEGQGNYAAALSLLWEASGLAPRDADVQNRLGEALERIGALDAAVDAYRRALAERPTFRKASNNLILALVKTGKGPEAVERARALVAEAPGDPDRYFTLGLAQSEQDVDGAIQTFRKVLELAPRIASHATTLRSSSDAPIGCRTRSPSSSARWRLSRARKPTTRWASSTGTRATWIGQRLRSAPRWRSEPRYADAHYTLGAVLKEQRDWAGATASLRRAIALRPDAAGLALHAWAGPSAERR